MTSSRRRYEIRTDVFESTGSEPIASVVGEVNGDLDGHRRQILLERRA